MNTKNIDYVITIADTKNLSLAAKKLQISEPALSKYLSRLESSLDTRLFIRNNHQIIITEAGEIYLKSMKSLKTLRSQMMHELKMLDDVDEIELNLGMSAFRGGREFSYFYPLLVEKYPRLILNMIEGSSKELLEKLYAHEINLMINLYHPAFMPDTKIITLTRQELLLALPKYHRLALNKSSYDTLTIDELSTLNDVSFVFLSKDYLIGDLSQKICERYGSSFNVLVNTPNSLAMNGLMASGNYAGFVMDEQAKKLDELIYFHLPHPVYLYSGMIFLRDHELSEVEKYLYWLEYQQVMKASSDIVYLNTLAKALIETGDENGY